MKPTLDNLEDNITSPPTGEQEKEKLLSILSYDTTITEVFQHFAHFGSSTHHQLETAPDFDPPLRSSISVQPPMLSTCSQL